MVEVRELKPTNRNLRRFIAWQIGLYKGSPYFVPPLRFEELQTLSPKFNPAYEFCTTRFFMAYKNGKPVGRVCALLNRRINELSGQKRMRFTRLDFIDDAEVADALMRQVESWASDEGLDTVHGPLGFCDLDKQGMLVEGFDQPSMFITIYNHSYYMKHMERLGYVSEADWNERILDAQSPPDEKLAKVAGLMQKRLKLTVAQLRKQSEVMPHVAGVFQMYNETYKNLYGMVPLTDKQMEMYTKQYFSFVNPDYISVVYDKDNRMAGFGAAIPSLARALRRCNGRLFPLGWAHLLWALKYEKRLELLLIGVRPDLQGHGVNAIIVEHIRRNAVKNGILEAETGPNLVDNGPIQAQWSRIPSRINKLRRCYVKRLA